MFGPHFNIVFLGGGGGSILSEPGFRGKYSKMKRIRCIFLNIFVQDCSQRRTLIAIKVFGLRYEELLAWFEEETVLSSIRSDTDRLLSCLIVGHLYDSGISIPLFLLMSDDVKLKCYLTIASFILRDTRVPVRVSVNKLILFPNQIMPGIIAGVFRNGWELSSWRRQISHTTV